MEAQGLEIFGHLAGVVWLLFFIITLLLGVLAVLLPFFVWRIWKWSHATCQEVVKLNGKIERLAAVLERGTVATSLLKPPPQPEETFTFAPATEEPLPEAAAEEPPEPAPAATLEEEPLDLEPFPAEEGEEPAGESFEPAPSAAFEEEPFDLEPFPAEEPYGAEPAPAAEPFEPEPFPTEEQEASVETSGPPAAAEEGPAAITPLPGAPGKPGTSFARCEECGHKLAYKESLAGKRIRCPSCKTIHTLP